MPRWNSFEAFLKDANLTTETDQRARLVDELLAEHSQWPWVQGNRATFIYTQSVAIKSVALNLDTIKADPPFAPMTQVAGTKLWHVTREFETDDLLDYLLAINDPMTPLAQEKDVVKRVGQFWKADMRNPLRMQTVGQDVSVLRMGEARPFPDWAGLKGVPRGKVDEHEFDSFQLKFKGRSLWVYTPPGYEQSTDDYPLLILQDGQWASGPLQVPYIADALVKHKRMRPVVIAMLQSGGHEERVREYTSNNRHYASLLTELLPFVQTHYRIDATNLGVGGVAVGAVAAAHAALMNPAVFGSLIMISPPLGKGASEDLLALYAGRFEKADVLPRRIFHSVGRYEAKSRFLRPAQTLRDILNERRNVAYHYAEIGSGHGLVGFRSILPEALAWTYPDGA
jgi:enterochelin esterase-like enzyme